MQVITLKGEVFFMILTNAGRLVLSEEEARELWGTLGSELEKITPDKPRNAPET